MIVLADRVVATCVDLLELTAAALVSPAALAELDELAIGSPPSFAGPVLAASARAASTPAGYFFSYHFAWHASQTLKKSFQIIRFEASPQWRLRLCCVQSVFVRNIISQELSGCRATELFQSRSQLGHYHNFMLSHDNSL
jgi:hypothetical protein